jgi:hypothetical protein
MSSYYRSESMPRSPFSAYMLVGSMSCNLKDSPLTGPDCPVQTVDFGRRVGASLPTEGGSMSSMNVNTAQALGSAYPPASQFRIYQ